MGNAKVIPAKKAILLPYQAAWVNDSSRLKIAEKSRQIGWTWATAYGLTKRKSLALDSIQAKTDAWISSRDDIQARLFLEDCKSFAKILQIGAQDLGEKAIDEKGNTAFVMAMANGLRIHSMSSNPDAQAGKRGDRVLDEFALHPDPRKLYAIAYPGNSGSPVYELRHGEVVAVLNSVLVKAAKESALKDPSAIAYAIPVAHLQALLAAP